MKLNNSRLPIITAVFFLGFTPAAFTEEYTIHGITITGTVDEGFSTTTISGSAELSRITVSFTDLVINNLTQEVESLGSGGFTFAGLEVKITELSSDNGKLTVAAVLILPENMGGTEISTSATMSGTDIDAFAIDFGDTVVQLGTVELSGFAMTVEFDRDYFYGTVTAEIPNAFGATVEIAVLRGQLDYFRLDVTGNPLATVFGALNLTSISGSAGNLINGPITITAGLEFNIIDDDVVSGSVVLLMDETGYMALLGSLDAFTFEDLFTAAIIYTPNTSIEGSFAMGHTWEVSAFKVKVDVGGDGTITSDKLTFSLRGDIRIRVFFTISATANVSAWYNTSRDTYKISGSVSVDTWAGTSKASFTVKNGNVTIGKQAELDLNYLLWKSGAAPMIFEKDIGYYSPELQMMTNYDLLDRAGYRGNRALVAVEKGGAIVDTTTVNLPYDTTRIVVIRNAWTGDIPAEMTLQTPSGALFTAANTPAFDPDGEVVDSAVLYNVDADTNSTVFTITTGQTDTPAGDYIVSVLNADDIGTYTLETLLQNESPTLTFNPLQMETDELGVTTYTVSWESEDTDDEDAYLVLHLAHTHNTSLGSTIAGEDFDVGNAGIAIPEGAILVNDTTDRSFTFTSARTDTASGDYFLQAVLDDGKNDPVYVHAMERIHIDNPNNSDVVNDVNVTVEGGTAVLTWDAVADVRFYRIYYGDVYDDRADDAQVTIRDVTTASIEDLEDGVTYRFCVRAVSPIDSVEGPASDFVIATVSNASIKHMPVVHSRQPRRIRYGDLYEHQIVARGFGSDALRYALISGPTGLVVTETGLISWTPTLVQIGVHDVVVSIRDGAGPRELSFTIRVLGGSVVDRNPEMVSTPSFDGVQMGETYNYRARAHGVSRRQAGTMQRMMPRFTYTLLDGPDGSSITPNGMFSFTPASESEATKAHQVVILAKDDDGNYVSQEFYIGAGVESVSSPGCAAAAHVNWRSRGAATGDALLVAIAALLLVAGGARRTRVD